MKVVQLSSEFNIKQIKKVGNPTFYLDNISSAQSIPILQAVVNPLQYPLQSPIHHTLGLDVLPYLSLNTLLACNLHSE